MAEAFQRSGGPVPLQGLSLGRGKACLCTVSVGGKCSRRHRPCLNDPMDATEIHLYRSHSVAPVLALKKRLRAVECLLLAIERGGLTLCRGLELHKQWSCILGGRPVGNLD